MNTYVETTEALCGEVLITGLCDLPQGHTWPGPGQHRSDKSLMNPAAQKEGS